MPNLVGIGLSQVPTNSMLGGLAYQSPDHASIKDLDLKNLSQINSEIAGTAVDIFVYDTSKDSDGGAWRKRTSHTSWYNETLNTSIRGSRREFPAVAVIVATSTTIKIYDGDDPDMPLWMFFDNSSGTAIYTSSLTSVSALNGKICWGMNSSPVANGLTVADFITDKIKKYTYAGAGTNHGNFLGNIADRNDPVGWDETYATTEVPALSQDSVHDIAMTVLPNAPIDSATGLPVPTIAIGIGVAGSGGGGVNIIKDDGTVVDIIAGPGAGGYETKYVEFGSNNELIHTQTYNNYYASVNIFDNIPTSDVSGTTAYTAARSYPYITSVPNIRGGVNGSSVPSLYAVSNSSGGDIAFGFQAANAKLSLLSDNKEAGTDATKSMVAYATTSYNTGWMHGDIKGAFLSDTDATNLSGYLYDDDMQNDDTSDWGNTFADTFAYVTSPVTAYQLTRSIGDARTQRNLSGTISAGTKIIVTYEAQASSGTPSIKYGMTDNSYNQSALTSVSINTNWNFISFEATFGTTGSANHTYVTLWNATAGATVYYRNFKVRVIEEDRSVNNNSLAYFGTITKSAVATGAELVGYSFGNSNANYLKQPYNSGLDFGTGNFSVMAWINMPDYSQTGFIFDRAETSGNYRTAWYIEGDDLKLYTWDGSASSEIGLNTVEIGSGYDGKWVHCVATRHSSGLMEEYINGVLIHSQTSTVRSVTSVNSNAHMVVGGRYNNSTGNEFDGSIALLRISGSIPSAEQVKKMYEDEKVLFQENAACTLYGSSDAVTALAYDEVTDRLHVGTSSGRSDFQGLRRINNTTTAVTTAISAHDEFIVEQ